MEIFIDDDKENIIPLIEAFVKRNGYVSVRFACQTRYKEVYNLIEEKQWKDDGHRRAFIKSVSSRMLNTGEYLREQTDSNGFDYDIFLNPSYFLNKSITKTSKTTMKIAWIALGISAITLIKDFCKDEIVTLQEPSELSRQLQKQGLSLELIPPCLEKIDQTIYSLKDSSTK